MQAEEASSTRGKGERIRGCPGDTGSRPLRCIRRRDTYGIPPRQHGGTDPPAGMQRGSGGCRAQAEHPSELGPILHGVLSIRGGGTLSCTPLAFCRGRGDSARRELPCAGQRRTASSATPPSPPFPGSYGRTYGKESVPCPEAVGRVPPGQDPLPALQRTAPRVALCQQQHDTTSSPSAPGSGQDTGDSQGSPLTW